jgi:hypothetical protein
MKLDIIRLSLPSPVTADLLSDIRWALAGYDPYSIYCLESNPGYLLCTKLQGYYKSARYNNRLRTGHRLAANSCQTTFPSNTLVDLPF